MLCLLVTVSCSRGFSDQSENYTLPSELSDCKIYRLTTELGNNLMVVRCPESSTSTTYSCGKNCKRTVTVI